MDCRRVRDEGKGIQVSVAVQGQLIRGEAPCVVWKGSVAGITQKGVYLMQLLSESPGKDILGAVQLS